MPRRLGNEHNTLKIQDNVSNSEIHLYYRMPTTKENVNFTNNMTKRKGNKIVNNIGAVRQKYGARILMGFREGDFEKPDGKGGYVIFSSDQNSKLFDPDWKKHVKKSANDLIEFLAMHVFEASAKKVAAEDPEEGDDDFDDEEGENIIDEDPEGNS